MNTSRISLKNEARLLLIVVYCTLHSKSLCYKSPPREGHLSRTGHIGGTYMLVYTVALLAMFACKRFSDDVEYVT
jgi:hypothetical protein